MRREKSCGAVVYLRTDDTIQYLLIKSLSGSYGFPKGHMEAGETERQTARREILEETGLEVTFTGDFRVADEYTIPKAGIRKQVVYFLAESHSRDYRFQETEVSGGGLYSFEEAFNLLSFPGAKGILRQAHGFLTEK